MKYFLTLLMIYAAVIGYAQTDTTQSTADKIIEGNKVKIILKEKQVVKINTEGKDTLVNRVESINIVTKGRDEREVDKPDSEDNDAEHSDFIETKWNSFQLGYNNALNSGARLEPDANYANMGIDARKSINVSWQIVTQAMNIYKDNIRLVYGIGIDINNYRFNENVDLDVPLILGAPTAPLVTAISTNNYKKNKLVTQYLTMPLLLNLKLSPKNNNDYVYISGGANFGYLIGSHQKQVWKDNGKKKNKKEDDFNLEQFRLGYEVQFGYKDVVLFGKYFPKSMFKENLGPDLRTVSIGILIGKV
jgi:hypothetical protein